MIRQHSKGDTIIEVMFSIVIFSLVVVSSITIMNKGSAMAQRSLEISLVRQQIDAQLSMIEYAHKNLPVVWASIIDNKIADPGEFATPSSCPSANMLSGGFFMTNNSANTSIMSNPISGANFSPAINYSMVDYTGQKSGSSPVRAYGLWAFITDSEANAVPTGRAYDVHVRACWNSVGLSVPMTIGTVVRMYDAG